jgi:hypothetical protein
VRAADWQSLDLAGRLDGHSGDGEASGVSKTLTVARSEAFLVNMILIDDLERFALHQGPPVDSTRLPGSDPAQHKVLESPDGPLLVQDWLVAYRQSIELLREFRNVLVQRPETVTDVDLREVTEAAERVLRGLLRRLVSR